jgi:hypothetical protein
VNFEEKLSYECRVCSGRIGGSGEVDEIKEVSELVEPVIRQISKLRRKEARERA